MYEEIDTHVIKSIIEIALAVIVIIPLAFMGAESVLNETEKPKIKSIIEQTDTYVIIKTAYEGNYVEGEVYDYSNGKTYLCYTVKDKGEYKKIDIFHGFYHPIVDGAVKIDTDENDKYICIDVGVNGYALYLTKSKRTNEWRTPNIIERVKYRATHLFAY